MNLLTLAIGRVTKYPDFTTEDMESSRTIYWEHRGILHEPSCLRRSEGKLAWYRTHGTLQPREATGENDTLIVTRDEANESIDSAKPPS